MRTLLLCALAATASAANHASASLRSQRTALRKDAPSSESVIKPLKFDQKLLICNAYPHKTAATVSKNGGKKVIKDTGLKFNQCEYAETDVLAHDKLDFALADIGIEGTFEVGSLPESDAVLLLVLERRDPKSSVVSFQSFAFPSSGSGDEAQLAVIDTYKGEAKMPHLKMADHFVSAGDDSTKEHTKRIEELNFNRVYAVEEGKYDASVVDRLDDKEAEKKLEKFGAQLNLKKGRDYVVIRTGDGKDFPQALVSFPPADSGAVRGHMTMWVAAMVLGLVWAR